MRTCILLLLLLAAPAWAGPPPGVEVRSQVVQGTAVQVVRVDLGGYELRTGLASDRVGRTEDLAGIASRGRAVVAINGSFFEAYEASARKNPEQNLVRRGQLVHRGGDLGCTLGVSPEGRVRIDPVRFTLEGAFEGDFGAWHAWWLNRAPGGADAITVFTSDWGTSTGIAGRQVAVAGGLVTEVADSSLPIPRDGFVVHFQGRVEAEPFRVGRPCRYRVKVKEGGPADFWSRVEEAVGAGPRLVRDGQIVCDPAAEGFRDPKILSGAGARSAVGLDARGLLLLVTTEAVTMRQLAGVMQGLGAVQAMNLDGGASSGLWTRDGYLREPGRELSNALLVVPRPAEPEPPQAAIPEFTPRPLPPAPDRTPLRGASPQGRPRVPLPIGPVVVLLGMLAFSVVGAASLPARRPEDDEGPLL